MKFQTALLFIAATSFALAAESVEVSDIEDFSPANVQEDSGVKSEPESLDAGNDLPNTLPEGDDLPDTLPEEPVDIPSTPPVTDDSADVASNEVAPSTEPTQEETPIDSANAEEKPVTEAANGEYSDDYGDSNEIEKVDGADVAADDNIAAEIENVENADAAAADVGDDAEDSADENDSSDATIAAGLAGAAALSSAGIFIWVKRSRRTNIDDTITMSSMA